MSTLPISTRTWRTGLSPLKAAMRASPKAAIGGAIVLMLVLIAIFAPYIAPNDPLEQDLLSPLLPPAWAADGMAQFPLGTDSLGRCVLSRLIFGTRIALWVGLCAATGAMLAGCVLALIAAYFGGRVDRAIGYLVDLWMSFPPVVLSLILMVGLGTGVGNVILSIILVDWTRFCRVVRAEALKIRRNDYVTAARLMGFGHLRVILREMLPGLVPLILTLFSLQIGIAIIVEAILSFVGLSVPADVVAWGVMIADARSTMQEAIWTLIAPVVGIVFTVFGFNLLSDGLRRALDPRQRARN
ncbi:ABC transporter permease [Bordetella genomosp. 4]|uniref:ABC transporter permease n=1 Tax=Bordetella genomosp. 4 TaxID=463044 RepID=A0A261U236_9BORD|nr:ABC transporter permease [Bordetella genomosp. 4]OZI56016.1 ABC transporter permease [Bordetella genomosp. 4]